MLKKIQSLLALSTLTFFISCISGGGTAVRPEDTEITEGEPAFYKFKINSLDGETIDFSKYKGKKVLIVNTASKCGFTGQYTDLQKLHTEYSENVVVLGFPCNQFGGQEPGEKNEIKEFCKINYGVTFQMFEKVDVKGSNQHPLFKWLSTKTENGWNAQTPTWNFCKYLINEKGELTHFFPSNVNPMSSKILDEIKK